MNVAQQTTHEHVGLIWRERELTLGLLHTHLRNCGLVAHLGERIELHSADGIGYVIGIDADRRFVRFMSRLPLNRRQSDEMLLELSNLLSTTVFLPNFHVDQTGRQLCVTYQLPYQFGLIAGQFAAIVHRFGSLLDYVVQTKEREDWFDFEDIPAPQGHDPMRLN